MTNNNIVHLTHTDFNFIDSIAGEERVEYAMSYDDSYSNRGYRFTGYGLLLAVLKLVGTGQSDSELLIDYLTTKDRDLGKELVDDCLSDIEDWFENEIEDGYEDVYGFLYDEENFIKAIEYLTDDVHWLANYLFGYSDYGRNNHNSNAEWFLKEYGLILDTAGYSDWSEFITFDNKQDIQFAKDFWDGYGFYDVKTVNEDYYTTIYATELDELLEQVKGLGVEQPIFIDSESMFAYNDELKTIEIEDVDQETLNALGI